MFSLICFREIVNLIQREKTHQQTKQNNNNQTTTTKYTPTAKATEAMLSFTIFVE